MTERDSPAMARCRLVAAWLQHEQTKKRRNVSVVFERVAARVTKLARKRVTTMDVVRWLNPQCVAPRPVRAAIEVLSADSPKGPVCADKW